MKRAFLVSVWFHLLLIVLVVVPTLHLGRRLLQPSVYQVRVVELPPGPAPTPPAPPEPPRVEPERPRPAKPPARPKITPPKPKAVAPLPPLKPKPETPPAPAPAPKPEAPAAPPSPPAPALMVQPKIDAPPEFDCASYCGVLEGKLEGQWTPPSVSAQGPVQAVVGFTINRDGSVDNVSLEKSSGNFYFDQAALRAVLLAAPLPPLPRTWANPTLRVHAPFTWQGQP